jgi:exosome complex component RRP4
LNIGDLIIARIVSFDRTRDPMLTVQDKDLGKIPYGEFIKISPTRVPRLIGKRGSMIQTIEQATQTRVIIGQNGIVVVTGRDIEGLSLAVKAIKMVEEESHTTNLTQRVKSLLNVHDPSELEQSENALSSTAEVSNDALSSTAEVSNDALSSTAEVSNDAVSSSSSSSSSSPTPPVTSNSSSQINLDTQEQSYSTAESQPQQQQQQQNFASVDSSNIKDDVEQSENDDASSNLADAYQKEKKQEANNEVV